MLLIVLISNQFDYWGHQELESLLSNFHDSSAWGASCYHSLPLFVLRSSEQTAARLGKWFGCPATTFQRFPWLPFPLLASNGCHFFIKSRFVYDSTFSYLSYQHLQLPPKTQAHFLILIDALFVGFGTLSCFTTSSLISAGPSHKVC